MEIKLWQSSNDINSHFQCRQSVTIYPQESGFVFQPGAPRPDAGQQQDRKPPRGDRCAQAQASAGSPRDRGNWMAWQKANNHRARRRRTIASLQPPIDFPMAIALPSSAMFYLTGDRVACGPGCQSGNSRIKMTGFHPHRLLRRLVLGNLLVAALLCFATWLGVHANYRADMGWGGRHQTPGEQPEPGAWLPR